MSRKKRKSHKKKTVGEPKTPERTPPKMLPPTMMESVFQLAKSYMQTLYAFEANLPDDEQDLWFTGDSSVEMRHEWSSLSQEEADLVVSSLHRQIIEIKTHLTKVRGVPKLTLTGTEYPFPDKGA
jgi:hypothetical protein